LEALEKCWDDYHQREATIKAQIFTTVPDSVLIEVRNLDTAQKVWDAVCAKYETKSLTVKIDLQRRMYEMKCEDDANVRTHLETLMRMQEQLAGMNTPLTNNDLVTVILGLLPKSYRSLINAITMSVAHAKAKLEPDQVVSTLIDEFE
jgi:gag-polypeptide of LTR copia-type